MSEEVELTCECGGLNDTAAKALIREACSIDPSVGIAQGDIVALRASMGVPEVRQVILKAPSTVIAPKHQACGSKFSYYGIKNPTTGEGIEKLKPDWNQGEPGIRVKKVT
jgi:hypothetical protein